MRRCRESEKKKKRKKREQRPGYFFFLCVFVMLHSLLAVVFFFFFVCVCVIPRRHLYPASIHRFFYSSPFPPRPLITKEGVGFSVRSALVCLFVSRQLTVSNVP
jgi:ABC-type phosphate transport system permease subunit